MAANGMLIEWTFELIGYLDLYGYVHRGNSKENVLVLVLVLIQKVDERSKWCLACEG